MATAVIAATAPTPPDFHVCDPLFGRFGVQQCLPALNSMSTAEEPVDWQIRYAPIMGLESPNIIPKTWHPTTSDCFITLGTAGPNGNGNGHTVSMAPNVFREMAGYIVTQCVAQNAAGGYITSNISNTIDYLINPRTNLAQPAPASSLFFTITVKASFFNYQMSIPGQTDPATAGVLYAAVQGAAQASRGTGLSRLLQALGYNWERMTRGGGYFWYQGLRNTIDANNDQMAYVCDANLGHPAQIDCSKLQYSEIGPPSDTITIRPGAPQILNSGTCNVAISADSSTVLAWAEIKSAINTLIEICVDNPLDRSQGGRAVAGTQPLANLRPPATGNRKKSRRVGRRNTAAPTKVLPHGVKVTVSGPH